MAELALVRSLDASVRRKVKSQVLYVGSVNHMVGSEDKIVATPTARATSAMFLGIARFLSYWVITNCANPVENADSMHAQAMDALGILVLFNGRHGVDCLEIKLRTCGSGCVPLFAKLFSPAAILLFAHFCVTWIGPS